MNIGSLIATNIVNGCNPEITNALISNPEFSLRVDDRSFTNALISNLQFLDGGWGTAEQFCYKLIEDSIKAYSRGPVITGAVPALVQFFGTMPNAAEFKQIFVYQAVTRMAMLHGWTISQKDIETLSDNNEPIIQTFEYLNKAVALMYSKTETKGDDGEVTVKRVRELVTRNYELIAAMSQLGMIAWKEGQTLNDIASKLWAPNEWAALKKGMAWAIHLRGERVVVGQGGIRIPVFSIAFTRGRTNLKIAEERSKDGKSVTRTYMMPLAAIYAEERKLKSLLSDGAYKVTKLTDHGPKERIITSSPLIVKQAYSEIPETVLNEKLATLYDSEYLDNRSLNSRVTTGFDIVSLSHNFVDLEASIQSSMTWRMQPSAWETIVKVDKIDKTCHNVDHYIVNQFFNSKILNGRKRDFACLPAEFNLASFKYRREKAEQIMRVCADMSDNELFMFINNSAYKPIFGDVPTQLAERARNKLKYLKSFTPVDMTLARDPEKFTEEINKMLKSGTVRFALISQTAGRYELIGTNNETVLKRTYGEDYEAKYGSKRYKLRYALAYISSPSTDKSPDALKEMMAEYGLDKAYALDAICINAPTLEATLKKDLDSLVEKDFDLRPGTIRCKVADGYKVMDDKGNVSLYRNFNVANIVGLAYAPVNT